MRFNIELYSDGLQRKFGNVYDKKLDDAVDELMYYLFFSEQYTFEEMEKYLKSMKPGYTMRGDRFSEFKITKNP